MMLRRVAPLIVALLRCDATYRFDQPPADAGKNQCQSNSDCSTLGLRCDVESGRCVACLSNRDCASLGSRCDTTNHVCVQCIESTDCREHQQCDRDSKRCLDTCHDSDDVCPLGGFACDPTKQLCVECSVSASCASSARGPRCDTALGLCVECIADAQCPPDRPKCDRTVGRCVGCATASDCSSGLACDPRSSACTPL